MVGSQNIAAVTTSATGTSCDFADEVANRASCIQYISTVSGTGSPTQTGKIQESTDGTTWTDITGATFTATTTSNNVQLISFNVLKRYVRGYDTISGTTSPSFTLGRTFLAQRRMTPANNGGWVNDAGGSV